LRPYIPAWHSLSPIAYVRVQGDILHLDPAQLSQALLPAARMGFLALDLAEIEGVARSFPWVDAVRVKRIWPDVLEVQVAEHTPVARWGDVALLGLRGERFQPEGVKDFVSLPVIYGQPGMEQYLLGILKSLNAKVELKGMSVVSLDLSKRRAWIVKLSSGLEMHLGRQDPVLAMDRFLQLSEQLGEHKIVQYQRVDLRYPNGFAVVLKPETVEEAVETPESGAKF
jgi:cell division protein FtsQ